MRSGENDTSIYKWLDELARSTPFMYIIINLPMGVILVMNFNKHELQLMLLSLESYKLRDYTYKIHGFYIDNLINKIRKELGLK